MKLLFSASPKCIAQTNSPLHCVMTDTSIVAPPTCAPESDVAPPPSAPDSGVVLALNSCDNLMLSNAPYQPQDVTSPPSETPVFSVPLSSDLPSGHDEAPSQRILNPCIVDDLQLVPSESLTHPAFGTMTIYNGASIGYLNLGSFVSPTYSCVFCSQKLMSSIISAFAFKEIVNTAFRHQLLDATSWQESFFTGLALISTNSGATCCSCPATLLSSSRTVLDRMVANITIDNSSNSIASTELPLSTGNNSTFTNVPFIGYGSSTMERQAYQAVNFPNINHNFRNDGTPFNFLASPFPTYSSATVVHPGSSTVNFADFGDWNLIKLLEHLRLVLQPSITPIRLSVASTQFHWIYGIHLSSAS